MNQQDLIQGLSLLTYGLYVVTSSWEGKDGGLVVNTVFQVTAEPPRAAISVNKNSLTHELISHSRVFAAMPLEQQTDLPFIGRFGFRTGRTFDKFAGLSVRRGVLDVPLVQEHTLGFLEVAVDQVIDEGTHTLFVGPVKNAGLWHEGEPLTYEYYHKVIKGKTPKGATHA